jgi:hypothetical protein
MNVKLMLTVIAALAFAPLVATHHGLHVNPGVGSGYTRAWRASAQGDASEQRARFECTAAGADLLRRAAPPLNGRTPELYWARRAIDLAPSGQLVCLD